MSYKKSPAEEMIARGLVAAFGGHVDVVPGPGMGPWRWHDDKGNKNVYAVSAEALAERVPTWHDPVPAPPEAEGVTVEALDEWIAEFDRVRGPHAPLRYRMLRALRSLVVLGQRAGGEGDLEKLVEESECKRRIEAAGWWWNLRATNGRGHVEVMTVEVQLSNPRESCKFTTWPEAAAWAEAQAAPTEPDPKERWSKPVWEMNERDVLETLTAIGVPICGSEGYRYSYLRGEAGDRERWDRDTDRIKLPPEGVTA